MTDALSLTPEAIEKIKSLPERELRLLIWAQKWRMTRRGTQTPPEGLWSEFGLCAGRGHGKSMAGAHWLVEGGLADPQAEKHPRAVIAPTLNDVRYTCFEGPTGILSILPPEFVKDYNKTNLIITLDNGLVIRGFSSEEPERLRGPQFSAIWCDELCLVAGTLIRTPTGDVPIESLKAGDLVETRVGSRRVLRAWQTTNAATTWELRTSDGKALRGTAGHPVWTAEKGFIPLSSLLHGFKLQTWDMSFGTVKSGGSGKGTTKTEWASFSTGRNTNIITAHSRSNSMCTTSTATRRTTNYPIWRRLVAESTYVNMGLGVSSFGIPVSEAMRLRSNGKALSPATFSVRSAERISNRRAPAPNFAAKSVLTFSGSFQARAFPCLGIRLSQGLSRKHASSARRFLLQKPERQSVAVANAGLSYANVENLERSPRDPNTFDQSRTHGQEHVYSANGNFKLQRPQLSAAGENVDICFVLDVQPSGLIEPVFNIEVEGQHEYFANGILTHNCAWTADQDTWDMMKMGLRLGPNPQVMWTTTPKPKDLIRKLVEPKAGRVIKTGSTYDNKDHLPDSFFEQLKQYENTQLGRQELMGEIIDAEEGAIIARKWLKLWPAKKPLPAFEWIIMSLDTAFTEATLNKKTQTADPTASGTFGIFWHEDIPAIMLLDCWSDHLGFPDLIKRVKKEMAIGYGDDEDRALIKPLIGSSKPYGSGRKPDLLIIEEKGSGISLRQALEREGILAYAYNPGRADKTARLHMVSHIFARGQFWVPESENYPGRPKTWVEPLLAQLCSFSGTGSIKNDDFVDVVSQAGIVAVNKGLLAEVKRDKQKERDDDARESAPRVYSNPYSA